MKQGKDQQSFANKTHWSYQTLSSNNTRDNSTHGHHQMVNTKLRLIIFFAALDVEALYSQQKQDWELTVTQIMNSLLPKYKLKSFSRVPLFATPWTVAYQASPSMDFSRPEYWSG